MSGITERVERGAALLDEKRPGWWRDIDLERLELRSPCNCVVGQLNGSAGMIAYLAGIRDLGIPGIAKEIHYGFEAAEDGREAAQGEYDGLNTAWRDLITSRRAAAEVTPC